MADDEPAADNAAEPPANAAAEDVADADNGINNPMRVRMQMASTTPMIQQSPRL